MKKKLIIIIPILIALLVFIGVYAYFNHEDAKTSLTVREKKWITNNSDKKYDFEIVNNLPVYSMDGTGVIFDFINNFEIDTNLEFNKISYLKESTPQTSGLRIRILSNDTNLSENDFLQLFACYINENLNLVTEDKALLEIGGCIAKKERVISLSDLYNIEND